MEWAELRSKMLRLMSPSIQLILAIVVYSSCRPRSLYLNRAIDLMWDRRFDALAEYSCSCLPEIVVYSLPAALWLNATLDTFRVLMKSHFDLISRSTLAICVCSEFAQLFEVIGGSFDIFDLATYIGAYTFNQFYHGTREQGERKGN